MRISRLPSAILSLVVCLSISACGASLQPDDKPQIAIVDAVVTPSDADVQRSTVVHFRPIDGAESIVTCVDGSDGVACALPGVGNIRIVTSSATPNAKSSDGTPMPASVE